MISPLLLSMVLSVSQTEAPTIAAQIEPPADATTTPEQRLLKKSLQETSFGSWLDNHRIQIMGWTEGSFTASTASGSQLPMGFNYRANEFLLQQNWLRIQREVVTSRTNDPSFGFRSDTILPGSDYRFTVARGLWSRQLTDNSGEPNTYGIDPVQFYGEAYLPNVGQGLSIKVGRMFCQYGAEAIDAPANVLASHSYTFIYDPFTHTGVMGTLQATADWSIQLGAIMGPDVFIDPAASPYGMFSAKWAPKEGNDTVLFSMLVGSGRYNVQQEFNNPNIFDFVYTHKFNDELSYTLDALFGYQTNVPEIGTATWFGLVNYLTCKLSADLSATTRLEFFDDVDGQRTGYQGLYVAATSGLNWKLRPALILRPELRYDYNTESLPFSDKHGLFTATADVIFQW